MNYQKDAIIHQLKEQGLRIKKQRLIILDIILEGDCSCSKEIYYKDYTVNTSNGWSNIKTNNGVLYDYSVITDTLGKRMTADSILFNKA